MSENAVVKCSLDILEEEEEEEESNQA